VPCHCNRGREPRENSTADGRSGPMWTWRWTCDLSCVHHGVALHGSLAIQIRASLDPWLGKPKWKAGQGRFFLPRIRLPCKMKPPMTTV